MSEDSSSRLNLDFKIASVSEEIASAVTTICSHLKGLIPDRDVHWIELALKEVTQNAHEHGNLGIGFNEKKQRCEEGTFEELIEQRTKQAKDSDKKIHFVVKIDNSSFTCTVADEGDGFDWEEMFKETAILAKSTEDSALHLPLSGRGIVLIRAVFDKVRYNERGNSVILYRKLANYTPRT